MSKKALITAITIVVAMQAGIERSVAQQSIYVSGISATLADVVNYGDPLVGFAFRPKKEISVGALGVFDWRNDGLNSNTTDWQVGLWEKETQVLLAQATVLHYTGSAPGGDFRWEPIIPVTLAAGTSYVVAAYQSASGSDHVVTMHQSQLTHPDLDLEEGYHDFGTGLHFPSHRIGPGYIRMGPNLATSTPLDIRASEVNICWNSGSSNAYRVEYLSGVTNSSWLSLPGCFPSDGMETCIFDKIPQGVTNRFYRVVVTNCALGSVVAPAPVPHLTIRNSETQICWASKPGRWYEVDYLVSSLTNAWLPVSTNVLATGQTTCVFDKIPTDGSRRLYRVVLAPR